MRLSLVAVCLPLFAALEAAAEQRPSPADLEFFEKRIRPVLVEHCYACHSAEAKKVRGGLRLDTREALRKGGDSGPGVVPGKPDESLLIKAVRFNDEEVPKMPLQGKLPDAVIAVLTEWVRRGAPDPRTETATKAPAKWEDLLANRRGWWSLQPVRKGEPPAVKDGSWSNEPVDRFLLAKLEQAGLKPAPAAEPRTLVRRLHLVLTGLPPTIEDVDRFLLAFRARPQAAVEDAVDRLLSSPHFGERWARHWMDVVRFTETHGYEWNYEVHHAWRYRDYLIRAFNADVPFDRLIREHIAGDLLPPRWNTQEQFNEAPIGTAFFRFGEGNHDDCIEFRQIGFDHLDNQIDTLSKAFQGTTIACARCHDHKLDAVSQKDYYALLGILRSSRCVSHTLDAPEVYAELMRRLQALKAELRKELAIQWLADTREFAKRLPALKLDKTTIEDSLHPWKQAGEQKGDFATFWKALAGQVATESAGRVEFNQGKYQSFGDFRAGSLAGWQAAGQGLRDGPSPAGDFSLHADGEAIVSGILPAGMHSHRLSEKLNGALRSPTLPRNKKRISFRILGDRHALVRLVTNHCQLNYKNARYLKSAEATWVTFDIPEEADALRIYAEVVTKFDNPKWPDQLVALSGGEGNLRVPWEEAAKDPRSYFGVARVVLHDNPEPPKDELTHLRPLFAGPLPASVADLAHRYGAITAEMIARWADGEATDDDARWLDTLLRRGLLSNSRKSLGADAARLGQLVKEYREVASRLALPRIAPGMGEMSDGYDQPLLVRGDARKPGELSPRRYLEVLQGPGESFLPRGSGRLELAERLASPTNPLTARVMVNRVWHHLFGSGLVRTTDDFGRMGDPPSHPELLDYLAARFVEDGWSIKRLVRALVLTRAFQMSSRADARARATEPGNRLLHHYPARRLEAEAIRDAILATSGRLDRTLYGPSIQPYRVGKNEDRRLFPGPLDGNGRRSLYIKVNLMESPKFLGAFDLPGGKIAQGRRDVTNVPSQALALLNDPLVHQQAEIWADQLAARTDATVAERVDHLFRAALGRPPANEELARFESAITGLAELHGVPPAEILRSKAVWQAVAHALFNLKEFSHIH